MLVCSTSCGTPANAVERYDDCTEDVLRKYGANHFILQTCDSEWTDLLDTTEWTTKQGSDDVHVSPSGILNIQKPTSERLVLEGCGREVVTQLVYLVDFETYQTAEDLSDWAYWNQIFTRARSWSIMFVDCNGIFFLEKSWVAEIASGTPATIAGEQPGFEFSLIEAPAWQPGENGYGKWGCQFQIKTPYLMGMALLPGVQAVLE